MAMSLFRYRALSRPAPSSPAGFDKPLSFAA
jgi:hypothetical protein